VAGLVPELNPSHQGGGLRESAGRRQKHFLARSGRSSCAPPPGPRALCEVRLAFFFVVVFDLGYWAPVPSTALCQGVTGSAGEATNYFLACSGRASCAPPPGPRALCGVGLAAYFFLVVPSARG
jgi:hypothetical protein